MIWHPSGPTDLSNQVDPHVLGGSLQRCGSGDGTRPYDEVVGLQHKYEARGPAGYETPRENVLIKQTGCGGRQKQVARPSLPTTSSLLTTIYTSALPWLRPEKAPRNMRNLSLILQPQSLPMSPPNPPQ